MEFRTLGGSGFMVPVLSLGTGTFGGRGEFFKAWGGSSVEEATRLVDISLEAGLNMFDTADVYSAGLAEEILGKAIAARRSQVIVSTKASFRNGPGPNDIGSSRHHVIEACEGSLRRLGTDYVDLYQLHGFDALTSVEAHQAYYSLIGRDYEGELMPLAIDQKVATVVWSPLGWGRLRARYVAHQAYYSLIGRDYEWELMPLALDQNVATVVWSPLGWGRLTGKVRRNQPLPATSRLHVTASKGPPVDDEYLHRVVEAIDELAKETGKNVPQIAINWLLQRPTVANVIIGARDEQQLRQNLGAVGWKLSADQVARLDAASATTLPYPYWHQRLEFADRNPPPVK